MNWRDKKSNNDLFFSSFRTWSQRRRRNALRGLRHPSKPSTMSPTSIKAIAISQIHKEEGSQDLRIRWERTFILQFEMVNNLLRLIVICDIPNKSFGSKKCLTLWAEMNKNSNDDCSFVLNETYTTWNIQTNYHS